MMSQVAGLVVELHSRVYDMNACVHLPKRMRAIEPIYSGYVSLLLKPREHKICRYQSNAGFIPEKYYDPGCIHLAIF